MKNKIIVWITIVGLSVALPIFLQVAMVINEVGVGQTRNAINHIGLRGWIGTFFVRATKEDTHSMSASSIPSVSFDNIQVWDITGFTITSNSVPDPRFLDPWGNQLQIEFASYIWQHTNEDWVSVGSVWGCVSSGINSNQNYTAVIALRYDNDEKLVRTDVIYSTNGLVRLAKELALRYRSRSIGTNSNYDSLMVQMGKPSD